MRIIFKNGVKFRIDDCGVLLEMENATNRCKDVEIPKFLIFSDYVVEINALGSKFCNGPFRNVKISPKIKTVESGAFEEALVQTVYWPQSCIEIPYHCFNKSYMSRLYGIEKVTKVGEAAFAELGMMKLEWPANCEVIPTLCFTRSNIATIKGTEKVREIKDFAFANFKTSNILDFENVEKVGARAFSNSSVYNFKWPAKCKEIPDFCFNNSDLKNISNIEHVEIIGEFAFYGAKKLRKLDLTNSAILSVGDAAFARLNSDIIRLPYYVNPKDVFFDPDEAAVTAI